MAEKFGSFIDPGVWLPPDYEPALELPSNVTSIFIVREMIFANLEDGRTVDLTQLLKPARDIQ